MNLATILATLQTLDAFGGAPAVDPDPARLGRVTVATDLASAVDAVKPFVAMPCCVVHGLAERAEDNTLATGGPRQRVTATIRLLLVHRDVTDPHGAAAMAGIHTARAATLAALQGLIPDTGYNELLLNSGQLAYALAGTVMWLDEWRTAYYLEKPCT